MFAMPVFSSRSPLIGMLLLAFDLLLAISGAQAAPTGLLNDTGQALCDNGSNVMVTCNAASTGDASVMPRQDGRFGSDAKAGTGTLIKMGGGTAGFDFSKIANNGSTLHASVVQGGNPTEWACTKDNTTGLIWEVKATSGLRSKDHTYRWYNGTIGTTASVGGTKTCETLGRCDTQKFLTDVNASALCTYTDWRLPTTAELLSIALYDGSNPAVDASYFPNTIAWWYWSSETFPPDPGYSSFVIQFDKGSTATEFTGFANYIRLVRSGP